MKKVFITILTTLAVFFFLFLLSLGAGFLQVHEIGEWLGGTAYSYSYGPDNCLIGYQTGAFDGFFGSCPPLWEFGPEATEIKPPDL